MRPTRPAARIVALAVFACTTVLAGCGGGTDIAPSQPLPPGTGMASASLAGADFGSTQLVRALIEGVAPGSGQRIVVTDEVATVAPDGLVRLANGALLLEPVTVTEGGGPALAQGADAGACTPCDFWVQDDVLGVLRVSTTGSLQPGDVVEVDYAYERQPLSVTVGVNFALGRSIQIRLFNVDADQTGPLTVTTISPSAPGGPSFPIAFTYGVAVDLTQFQVQTFNAFDDPADPADNVLEITGMDLTNSLNPCIEGRLNGFVLDAAQPDPTNPYPISVTFSDPDC
jgi:hypothetical protein